MLELLKSARRRYKRLKWVFRETNRILADPMRSASYFPARPRKSKRRILLDHLRFAWTFGEFHDYYFMYGMDVAGRDPLDCLSW